MLVELMDLLEDPETLVCIWRDGELYIEPVTDPVTTTDTEQAAAA